MAKSPLLIGSDVRSIKPASLAILKSAELIAVNQVRGLQVCQWIQIGDSEGAPSVSMDPDRG
jgi:hypothetical protein